MTGIGENAFINVKNRAVTITADVEIPAGGANGVILCQGGRFGGWTLYMKDGKPVYTYNFVGLEETTIDRFRTSRTRQGDDRHDTSPTKAAAAKAARSRLRSMANRSEQGASTRTEPNAFSADDLADVGVDEGTPVSKAYGEHGNKFTGRIEKVRVDIK